MKILNSHRLSVFLMAGGLMLLLSLISVWLKSVYHSEFESLQKETNQHFLNAIREVEDSLMLEVFGPRVVIDSAGSAIGTKVQVTKMIIDSSSDFAVLKDKRIEKFKHGNFEEMAIGTHRTQDDDLRVAFGLLALTEVNDSLEMNANFLTDTGEKRIMAFLDDRFEHTISEKHTPLTYKIIELGADDDPLKGIWTNRYTDIVSGERYAVQVKDYAGFIIRRMTPEMIFSFLLFSSIALAFFMIFKSLKNQEKLNRLKNEFISNITHELKTPITTVSVAIEALRNFNALKDPAKTNHYLNISKHELQHLTILVDKVLKMSQFENKVPELKIEQLDLKDLIRNILDTMKLQFDKFEAKVDYKIEGHAFQIEGDRSHLTSVIYNLIDNALKYSEAKPEIEIFLEQREQQMRLKVKDHGIGISQEYKGKIFDKFFRVPTGDRHNVKGHGLGLSYVASIVNQHHGSIKVESQPGEGTCFTIDLPTSHE